MPTAAELAFIGDLFPLAFAEAFGRRLAISGLDNTIRFGTAVATGWVLIDSRPDFAAHGMGYGQAHMWAQDGTLLATASQSAILRALTPSRPLSDLTNRRLA